MLVAVVEKESGAVKTEPTEELYRRLIVHLIERSVQRSETLRVIIDKRYNNQVMRDRLTQAIETALSALPQRVIVTLDQADSKARTELLIADYVAWAVFQKYERNDNEPYSLIRERAVLEEICTQRALLTDDRNKKTVWHPGG